MRVCVLQCCWPRSTAWCQTKRPLAFSTWSTALVVKRLSAFYSRRFCLCRDGVVRFFIGVCLLFSGALWAPSKENTLSHIYFCFAEIMLTCILNSCKSQLANICQCWVKKFKPKQRLWSFYCLISKSQTVIKGSRVKTLYTVWHGMFTCLRLYCHYYPPGKVIWVFRLLTYHPFSVRILRSLEWSLEKANLHKHQRAVQTREWYTMSEKWKSITWTVSELTLGIFSV